MSQYKFEIHDPSGNAIDLRILDKEACEFWNVESHPRLWAHPDQKTFYTNSWFDSIGWAIANPSGHFKKWMAVKCTLWQIQSANLLKVLHDTPAMLAEIEVIDKFLKPYFELADYWESKGYIPIKIN